MIPVDSFREAFEWISYIQARMTYEDISHLTEDELSLLYELYAEGEDAQNSWKVMRIKISERT